KDAELAALRASLAVVRADLDAERELRRRLELRVAELERRLQMDSSDSGTPPSKEPVGAKEKRRAARRRQESERERRKDRRPGGQPGHPGQGLSRDLDPGERKDADPPGWAQVVDVQVTKTVTEWTLPGLRARAAARTPSRIRRAARMPGRCRRPPR